MYAMVVTPRGPRSSPKYLLARLGVANTYYVVATFHTAAECEFAVSCLNREIDRMFHAPLAPTTP